MKIRRRVWAGVLGAVVAVAAPAPAQSTGQNRPHIAGKNRADAATGATMQGPVLGYLYDATWGQLRAITGVSGAAAVDTAVALPGSWPLLSVAPRKTYGVGQQSGTDGLLFVQWPDGVAVASALAGSPATADLVSFSPSGTAFAVYSSDSNVVQTWTGFPTAPAMGQQWRVTNDPISALAVSDDGAAVAAIVGTDQSRVVLLTGDEASQPLASDGFYPFMQFRRQGHDLAYADTNANRITLLQDVTGSAAPMSLADGGQGLNEPVAFAFSADEAKLAVINRGARNVSAIDLSSGNAVTLAYDGSVQGFWPVSGNGLFRLNDALKGGVALLDLDAPQPQLYSILSPVSRDDQGGLPTGGTQ